MAENEKAQPQDVPSSISRSLGPLGHGTMSDGAECLVPMGLGPMALG